MPKVKLVIQQKTGKLTINGMDSIEFLISANLGEEPKPIAKIASGGELSRIMLALKNVIAEKDSIGTLIFDEIDTGVSGRAGGMRKNQSVKGPAPVGGIRTANAVHGAHKGGSFF